MLTIAVAALLAAAAPARADTYRLPEDNVQLDVPPSWQPQRATGPVARGARVITRMGGEDMRAVVTRIDVPRPRSNRDAMKDIERSLRRAHGYRRRARPRAHRFGYVRAFDFELSRTAPRAKGGARGPAEHVWIRYLFFRTYAVALVVAVPEGHARARRHEAVAMRDGFTPYFGD